MTVVYRAHGLTAFVPADQHRFFNPYGLIGALEAHRIWHDQHGAAAGENHFGRRFHDIRCHRPAGIGLPQNDQIGHAGAAGDERLG